MRHILGLADLKVDANIDIFLKSLSSLGLNRASTLISVMLIIHLIKKQMSSYPEIAWFMIHDFFFYSLDF